MPRTILVVDDDRSVRETLEFLLERRGYKVVLADSGVKALAAAAANVVDGALIDVHMPGANGITVCRTLRAQAAGAGRTLPVWMMTGARTSEIVRLAEEAGALMVLSKPFDYAELFRRFDAEFGPDPRSSGGEIV